MISKEEAKSIATAPGNIRGSAFLSDAENIRQRMGEENFETFKKAMEELGYPVDYSSIKTMAWYPIGLRALSFVVLKELFRWEDDDFRELGDNAPKYSFIVKFMMKFFASPEVAFSKAPEYWKKYYSIGTLEIGTFDETKKEVILYLRDFKTLPSYCRYLEGFFRRLMQYLRPGDEVRCEERTCEGRGEQCHEFRIFW